MIFFSEGKFGRKEFVNFISYSRSEVFFNSSNFLEFFDEQDSFSFSHRKEAVSYTHLTLPTILLV